MREPQQILYELQAMRESEYQRFSSSLLPDVDPARVLGVRVPRLRAYAKAMSTEERAAFLSSLPHRYHEENLLHALLINPMREFSAAVDAIDAFLPFVDNWAVCDSLRPACFSPYPAPLAAQIRRWMRGPHPFTVRFGIEMRMIHELGAHFDPCQLAQVAAVPCEEYYVHMMVAWYFATALALQPDATLPYLVERRLPPATHRKTIQKALESYRIPPEQKAFLRSLRD